jgi:hypothetical protein
MARTLGRAKLPALPKAKRSVALTPERGLADPEAKRLLRNMTLAARIDVAFLLVIVIDMTAKPFS